MEKTPANTQGISGIPILVTIGLVIAGLLFLITFITTQKASMPNKYQNLKLVAPSPPQRQELPLLLEKKATSSSSPETELQASPLTSPESQISSPSSQGSQTSD